MTNKLKTIQTLNTVFVAAVFFLSQTSVFADPQAVGGGHDSRPAISPNDVHLSNPNPVPGGNEFFGGGSGLSPVDNITPLTAAEKIFIKDLIDVLPAPVHGEGVHAEHSSPVGVVEKAIETVQRRMDDSSNSQNALIKPYSFFPTLKQENKNDSIFFPKKKKLLEPKDANDQDREIQSEIAPEVMPVIHPEQVVLDMKLEVTPEIVKAAEELNFTAEHPWLGWLAMKGIPEEVKALVTKAETQRKVMLEAAREAAKNGKKIVFIANKKVLSFYFNIPLFLEGNYELLILDEKITDPKPPVPVE